MKDILLLKNTNTNIARGTTDPSHWVWNWIISESETNTTSLLCTSLSSYSSTTISIATFPKAQQQILSPTCSLLTSFNTPYNLCSTSVSKRYNHCTVSEWERPWPKDQTPGRPEKHENKWQGNQLGFEAITDKEDAKVKTDILGLKLAFSAYMQI